MGTMKNKTRILLALAATAMLPLPAMAKISLGTAGDFSVFAGASVTNTGNSAIAGGNVGVGVAGSITGFSSATLAAPYATYAGGALVSQAQTDLTASYNATAALAPNQVLTGSDLGGMTLTPGTYFFATSAQLTGTLTLNNLGDSDAQFVFQIGSTLTTASNAHVVTINDDAVSGTSVFWQVGSSATLGTGTTFQGHILALTSITMNSGATILNGSALAKNGTVSLDTNTITNSVSAVPEPATLLISLLGGSMLLLRRSRS